MGAGQGVSLQVEADRGTDSRRNLGTIRKAPPSLFYLPLEIRLEIYRYLLRCREPLRIRNSNNYKPSKLMQKLPRFHIPNETIIDESQRRHFQILTVYRINSLFPLHPAILKTNRQIHREARSVLYGENCFAFFTGTFAKASSIIPFLQNFSSETRKLIRCVALQLGEDCLNGREQTRAWKNFCDVCAYFDQSLSLTVLRLGGRGIVRSAKMMDLLDSQLTNDRQIAIRQLQWVEHLLPVMKSLDKLTLPPKVDETFGTELRIFLSSETGCAKTRESDLREEDFL